MLQHADIYQLNQQWPQHDTFDMSAYDLASSTVSDDEDKGTGDLVDSAEDGEEGIATERPSKRQRTN